MNAYGDQAFQEINGIPDVTKPNIVEGGSPLEPNDYWNHVDYIIDAIIERNMHVALLPVWGRRYVNATHASYSQKLFTEKDMHGY